MSAVIRPAELSDATRSGSLHILAAARCLPFHSVGGMQMLAWDVLCGLVGSGHRVTVLTTAIAGHDKPFEDHGVRVVPLNRAPAERYSSAWWRASRRYTRENLAGAVDAVLSISSAAAGLTALKHSVLRVPFIYQAHGSSWTEAATRWQSPRPLDWMKSGRNLYWLARDSAIYRGFDRLVLVGDALARQFERAPLRWMTRGVPKTVIPNGIDARLFRFDAATRAATRARFGWYSDHRVMVFAARLHPNKGAAEAIRALAVLRERDPDFRLLLIGDGSEASALRDLSRRLACDDSMAFTGAVPREQVPALLAGGDVFVFPALGREGLPLNVLEALSVGLPCVCADSLRAVFGAALPVEYAPARRPDELADAIQEAVRHPSNGLSRLPARYSLTHCIAAYASVIGEMARTGR